MILPSMMIRILATIIILGILLRLSGRRRWESAHPLDLIVAFMLGNGSRDFIYGRLAASEFIIALSALIWLHILLTVVLQRSPRLRNLAWGRPVTLIHHGLMQQDAWRREGISEPQLAQLLKEARVEQIGDIQELILESNGRLKVTCHSTACPLQHTDPVGPDAQEDTPWQQAA